MEINLGPALRGKRLTAKSMYKKKNTRADPSSLGHVAFAVLMEADGATLLVEEYEKRLAGPSEKIRKLAEAIPKSRRGTYQDPKHILKDVYLGKVLVDPRLDPDWYWSKVLTYQCETPVLAGMKRGDSWP